MSYEEFAKDVYENWGKSHNDDTVIDSVLGACHQDGTKLTIYEKEKIRDYLKKEHRKMTMVRALNESDNSAFLAMVQKLEQAIKEEKK